MLAFDVRDPDLIAIRDFLRSGDSAYDVDSVGVEIGFRQGLAPSNRVLFECVTRGPKKRHSAALARNVFLRLQRDM